MRLQRSLLAPIRPLDSIVGRRLRWGAFVIGLTALVTIVVLGPSIRQSIDGRIFE